MEDKLKIKYIQVPCLFDPATETYTPLAKLTPHNYYLLNYENMRVHFNEAITKTKLSSKNIKTIDVILHCDCVTTRINVNCTDAITDEGFETDKIDFLPQTDTEIFSIPDSWYMAVIPLGYCCTSCAKFLTIAFDFIYTNQAPIRIELNTTFDNIASITPKPAVTNTTVQKQYRKIADYTIKQEKHRNYLTDGKYKDTSIWYARRGNNRIYLGKELPTDTRIQAKILEWESNKKETDKEPT